MSLAEHEIRVAHGEAAQPPSVPSCSPEVYTEVVTHAEAKADWTPEAD
jgi:hypothetical protein